MGRLVGITKAQLFEEEEEGKKMIKQCTEVEWDEKETLRIKASNHVDILWYGTAWKCAWTTCHCVTSMPLYDSHGT